MGETVDVVFLATANAPVPYSEYNASATALFDYKSTIVGVDVVESGENFYALSLVCLRDMYAAPLANKVTRFFKITNGKNCVALNNEAMYVGAAQIRTHHSSFVSDPQNMHVDMGQIYTLHIFEEST